MSARLTDEQTVPVMRAAGLEPLEPYPRLGRSPWLCLCNGCGREVSIRFTTVRNNGVGCPYSAGIRVHTQDSGEARDLERSVRSDGLAVAGKPFPNPL